jgi:hypothetical protein
MAGKIRADRDVTGTTSRQAKAKADKAFNGVTKSAADTSKAPALHVVEGHNGPNQSLMRDMYLEAKALAEKVATANGRYRSYLKSCKDQGIDPKVITHMMRWEKQDPDEAKAYWRQFRRLHEATDQEVQMDLFTGTVAPVSREAEIFDQGYKCGGRGGAHSESQWDAGTPFGQIWLAGFAAGNARLANEVWDIKPPAQETPASDPPEVTH